MNWEVAPPVSVPDSDLLIESDGIPLESHWHVPQIHLLIDSIRLNSSGRLWLDELQMWLGAWRGKCQGADKVWLRLFDARATWF